MYGVKFQNDHIVIHESDRIDELQGMELCRTFTEAQVAGLEMEHYALKKEFLSMDMENLKSGRAKEIEKRIWGNCDGYIPGYFIEEQFKKIRN